VFFFFLEYRGFAFICAISKLGLSYKDIKASAFFGWHPRYFERSGCHGRYLLIIL